MKLTAFASLLVAATLGAEEKIDLRLEWKSGRRYVQHLHMQQVLGVPRHGEASASTHFVVGLTAAPNGKSGGSSLAVSYDTLKVDVDMPLPKPDEKFDSAKPADGNRDLGSLYDSLRASATRIEVDDRGKVNAIKGLETLKSGDSVLSRFFGREQLYYFLQQGWLLSLPAKPVVAGESWPFKTSVPTPVGKLSINGAYTLRGREECDGVSCVVIEINGLVDAKFASQADDDSEEVRKFQAMLLAMGLKVKEGGMTGKIFFDPKISHIRRAAVESSLRLSVAVFPENGKPAEIPIRTKLESVLAESVAK